MHEIGALNTLMLCGVLSVCVLVGYVLKQKKIYYMPESAAVMLLGVIIGGVVELFSPSREELFYHSIPVTLVLLPPSSSRRATC